MPNYMCWDIFFSLLNNYIFTNWLWRNSLFQLVCHWKWRDLWRQKNDTELFPLALNLLCMPSARTSMMPWVGSVRLTWFTGMLFSVLLLGCCSCWCLFLMNDVNSHRVKLLFPSTNNLVSCQIYLVCSSSYYALWEFTKELMFKLWFT